MRERLASLVVELRQVVAALEPERLDGDRARGLAEVFAEVERLAAAGKTLAVRRVAATGAWRRAGPFRDAAGWLASVSGTSVGEAVATLESAERLASLPASEAVLRAGGLSMAQAAVIAGGAAADVHAERRVLESAARDGLKGLRDECAGVKAAARTDGVAHEARIRAARSLRSWTDADGVGRIDIRGPVVDTATVMAALEPFERARFDEARAAEEHDRADAWAFDALVAMAQAAKPDGPAGGTSGATVVVRVDHAALVRGALSSGERCEIAGAGPIPVFEASRILDDAFVKAVVRDDTTITAVAHLGRLVPARLRTALDEQYPECAIEGCHVTRHLEIDHNLPVEAGGLTALDNLSRVCRRHHRYKHAHDLRLAGTGTHQHFVPAGPDPPPPDPSPAPPEPPPRRRSAPNQELTLAA